MPSNSHFLTRKHIHYGWDNSYEPALTIKPGDTVEFETVDASGGQLTQHSNVADVANLDFAKVNPATGPVWIDGAKPGDALKITILAMKPSGWGWTANIPGFGLLADRFKDPALHIWHYDPKTLAPAEFKPGGRVPLQPFPGVIGCAPAEPGHHSVVPPRRVGGNMDTRDIVVGSELYLPVEVPGAMFSLGDTHAGQGDGEVCGTAIESPMDVTVRLEVVKGAAPRFPRIVNPGPRSRHMDGKGYDVTTGVGPDLMTGAKEALSQMVDFIAEQHKMTPVEAYMLCSACADLKISEIVDQPNWIVSCCFPRIVFA
ncbi:MAG: acetamidase/formamidase family protein [Geminicoccaceae bacterium]